MRTDILDFPTAWEIQKTKELKHHEKCSSVLGHHSLSGPHFLCDCGVVEKYWEENIKK